MKAETKKRIRIGAKAIAIVAILLSAADAQGWAQARGGGASFHSGGARPAARSVPHVATPLNPNFAPLRGIPGLGFDYEHLAAINRPSLQRRPGGLRNGRAFLTPIYGFGFPYYDPYDYDTDESYGYPTQLQPQFPVQAPPSMESAPSPVEAEADVAPAPAPAPELGQLVLVRNDGQLVMAVAFTTSGGKLTYITQDGLRRSFPLSELDKDATRQMNEVNGTSVSLPD